MLKKILSFYTRYFALWVVLFGAAAYVCPGPFAALEEYNKLFFSLTMFGIGAVLDAADFKRIVQRPIIVLIGTVVQFTIMPFAAFALARVFRLGPEITVGLILTAAAPGAMASNVMSYVAKADIAYSVSLTTVSTLLCPLMTPGLTYLLAGSRLEVHFWAMALDVMYMVVAPLLVGFGVRHYFKEKVEKIAPMFPAISVTFIIFICSLVIALNKERLAEVTGVVLAVGVIMNVFGMLGGYWVAAVFRMDKRQRRTLSIEGGMQNAGLGTVLALEHFGEKAAMPAAIFVFICIITGSVMAAVWSRDGAEDRQKTGVEGG